MPAALRQLILGVLATTLLITVGGGARAQAQSATSAPVPVATAPAATGARAGDTASSRTVNRIVLALLAMAGLLAILALWLWRTSKPKPNHLDGLDAMGSRRWRSATPERRAAILGPVHLRRGEIRDEDLIATPEPAEAEPEPVPVEAPPLAVGLDSPPSDDRVPAMPVPPPEPGEQVEPDEPSDEPVERAEPSDEPAA
jgi:hypothetical protein